MRTFFCLCMSPAIDALVRLPHAPTGAGEVFKDVADEENVGGKAINVARWLALRGEKVTCGGLLGADNAVPFERELARCGIGDRFLRVPGATRRNEMIAWPGGAFKVNRAAFADVPAVTAADVLAGADGADVAIVSGSLPKCCAPSFYAECVRILKAKGLEVVLDTSGRPLELGVAAGPDLIKPNAEECEPLVGFVPKTPEDFLRATEALRARCAHVIISDGGAGAWFDGAFVAAPPVEVVDTTAAGDTLLAEWCCSRDPRLAVAAGSAACTMPGSRPPTAWPHLSGGGDFGILSNRKVAGGVSCERRT